MKNIIKALILINVLFILCSCTAESKTDLIGFCKRVNKQTDLIQLDDSAYYFDGENEYCFNITLANSDCILSLSTDSRACVNELRLTTVNDTKGIDGNAVFGYYITLCSVLTGRSQSELRELFEKNGLTQPFISFSDSSVEIEDERFTCFIYTTGQIVSLYCAAT